jgi:hypothetical protein
MVTRPLRTAVPTPATHRCRWKKKRRGRGYGRTCVSAYMSVCARVMVRPMRKTAERMRASAWMVTYWLCDDQGNAAVVYIGVGSVAR